MVMTEVDAPQGWMVDSGHGDSSPYVDLPASSQIPEHATTESAHNSGRGRSHHGELLAAIRWSLSGDGSHAVAIIAALGRLWYSVGMNQQLRILMLAAVQHADVKPSADLAVAMSHTGFAWYFEDADPHAVSLVEEAVRMARDVGGDGAVGTTLTRLAGVVSEGLGDGDTGLELELEGYELLNQSRHPDAEHEAYNLAQHLAVVGRLEEASRLLGEFIESASATGSPTYEATALFGHYLIAQGQLVEGIEASERGVEMLERLGRYHTLIAQSYFLGLAYSLAERHDEAIAMLHRSAACWDHVGREVPEKWRPPAGRRQGSSNLTRPRCDDSINPIVDRVHAQRDGIRTYHRRAESGLPNDAI